MNERLCAATVALLCSLECTHSVCHSVVAVHNYWRIRNFLSCCDVFRLSLVDIHWYYRTICIQFSRRTLLDDVVDVISCWNAWVFLSSFRFAHFYLLLVWIFWILCRGRMKLIKLVEESYVLHSAFGSLQGIWHYSKHFKLSCYYLKRFVIQICYYEIFSRGSQSHHVQVDVLSRVKCIWRQTFLYHYFSGFAVLIFRTHLGTCSQSNAGQTVSDPADVVLIHWACKT